MKEKLSLWDTSEVLETEEDIKGYLTEVFNDGDCVLITKALNNVAKARYMTELANKMGITRSDLYKMLTDYNNIKQTDINGFLDAVGVSMPEFVIA